MRLETRTRSVTTGGGGVFSQQVFHSFAADPIIDEDHGWQHPDRRLFITTTLGLGLGLVLDDTEECLEDIRGGQNQGPTGKGSQR